MARKKQPQPTDGKATAPPPSATIAPARGTTRLNAGPRVATKKDSACPVGLITITVMIITITVTDLAEIAITTAAATTGIITGTTTPTITQTPQMQTSRHGQ